MESLFDDRIAVMARIEDRHRSFVLDDTPVATGVVALADSWACTRPIGGSRISIGTIHAVGLRDVLREVPADPIALQQHWHDVTMATAEPWYRETLAFDEALAEIDALLEGRPPEPTPEFEIGKAWRPRPARSEVGGRDWIWRACWLSRRGLRDVRVCRMNGGWSSARGWRDDLLPEPGRDQLVTVVGS